MRDARIRFECLLGALVLVTAAHTQQAPAPGQSAFAAASIRPAHLTAGCFSMLPPGGLQYALTCVTLRNLIEIAYQTSYIDGGQPAINTYYDLRATTLDGQPWTMSTVRPMLQQLLRDRFHLQTHAGKRELAGYGLIVAKGGAKLQAVAPEAARPGQKAGEPAQNFISPGRVQARGAGMDTVAALLAAVEHAPVTDKTGLTGTYNVDLRYAEPADATSDLPSFPTALEEQLGLKLRPEKVTVDTLVIDYADEIPTPD